MTLSKHSSSFFIFGAMDGATYIACLLSLGVKVARTLAILPKQYSGSQTLQYLYSVNVLAVRGSINKRSK